ncbi:solute carrier family 22 member 21-like [Styela clava]
MSLVCSRAWLLPFSISMTMIGRSIGNIVCGVLSDRFGRRTMFGVSSVLVTLSTLVVGLSRDVYIYTIFLSLMVALSSVQYNVTFVIGSEMVLPRYRNIVGGMVMVGYIIGYASLPLIAYLSNDWHIFFYIITGASSVFLWGYWTMPETLHWLITKKMFKRAKSLIAEIAEYNKSDGKIDEMILGPLNELKVNENSEMKERENTAEKVEHTTVLQLIKHPLMRSRFLEASFSWFVASFVYYAITLNSSYLPGNRYINCLASALLEIPSTLLAYILLDKIGRVKTSSIFFFTSGIACIIAPLLATWSNVAVSLMIIAGKTAVSGAYYVIFIHTPELAPTLSRNLFIGVCNAFAYAGSFLSPYVMYIGTNMGMETVSYVLMGGMGVVASVSILLFSPETMGTRLPSTIEDAATQKTVIKGCCRRRNEATKPAIEEEISA